MGGREIPFYTDAECDVCHEKNGAFDFMGDLLCAECIAKLNKRNRDEQKTSKKTRHTGRHRNTDGRDGRPEDI